MSPVRVTARVAKPADSFTLAAALLNCSVASSFTIVTVELELKIKLTLEALLRLIVKVSSGSIVVSPFIGTLIVAVDVPGVIVSVPEVFTKSLPAVAVPLDVA